MKPRRNIGTQLFHSRPFAFIRGSKIQMTRPREISKSSLPGAAGNAKFAMG